MEAQSLINVSYDPTPPKSNPPRRRVSTRRHTLPGAPRLTVVPGLRLCLESEAVEGEKE